MKLSSAVFGCAFGSSIPAKIPRDKAQLGADVLYTPYQLSILEQDGFDTTNYPVDDSLPDMPIEMGTGTDLPWQAVWRNPEGYDGDGEVIIPYRFQAGGYTRQQEDDIQMWLAELSEYLGNCVRFINDTNEEKYEKDYIYVVSKDEDGEYYKGDCWSYIGNQTKYYKMDYQELALSVLQPDYYWHCLFKPTVQHEFMHALGFHHEQNRPDRDQFIDVHLENVLPLYRYNFDKMRSTQWDDQGEVYDFASVMHYDGDAFLTDAAYEKGLSSMTYKDTDERVIVNAARATSIDVVQIAKRYHDFCPIPKTKFCPSGEYYLEGRDCDAVVDCADKSDEPIDECKEYNCGMTMYLTSESEFGGTLEFHWVSNEYINNRPYWYNKENNWYLYSWRAGSWYIHQRLGNDWGYYWGDAVDPCPTGRDFDWWSWNVEADDWLLVEDFSIRGE